MYLAAFRDRQATWTSPERDRDDVDGDDAPLYLKRFRGRTAPSAPPAEPLWQRSDLSTQQALTEDNRNKEISAPPASVRQLLNDVYLIRHGETQGYSTDSGLTPQGAWQAHTLRPHAVARG